MLEEIPAGCRIFIDSNIFIYHFLNISASCTQFLGRVERKEIEAYTSTIVLEEVMHRLMIAELVEKHDIKLKDALKYLKQKPDVLSSLDSYETAVKKIPDFGVNIVAIPVDAIFQSMDLRKRYYLMTHDSINLYIMKISALFDIATNDTDFNRVNWIRVWRP